MKGIISARGRGTRLPPITHGVSTPRLPLRDTVIEHALGMPMLAGIRDIPIISTPEDLPRFQHLLGGGESRGLSFSYAEQPRPDDPAPAFAIGVELVGSSPAALVPAGSGGLIPSNRGEYEITDTNRAYREPMCRNGYRRDPLDMLAEAGR